MAVRTFAAIDVGSFELSMKIFEVSRRGMKEIDHIRRRSTWEQRAIPQASFPMRE